MRTRYPLRAFLGIALAGIVATAAIAQGKPEVLVKQRQAAMTLQGKYFGPLAAMVRGTSPYDAGIVARNARYLEVLADMPWDGFAEETRGLESRALPSVWADAPGFRLKVDEFQSAVAALVSASGDGREAEARAAIEGVANSCGGCHDDFRRK